MDQEGSPPILTSWGKELEKSQAEEKVHVGAFSRGGGAMGVSNRSDPGRSFLLSELREGRGGGGGEAKPFERATLVLG